MIQITLILGLAAIVALIILTKMVLNFLKEKK